MSSSPDTITVRGEFTVKEVSMLLHRRVSIPGLTLALLAAVTMPMAGQGASPLTGTWQLNLGKSNYSPSALAPRSGTTTFQVSQDTVQAVVDGVDAQGRTTHQQYTATFDGKDYPCGCTINGKPSPDQDAVAWRKIDDRTYEITGRLNGQALTTNRIVVAADGKSRTNTVTGKNAQGQSINNTVVYEKQ